MENKPIQVSVPALNHVSTMYITGGTTGDQLLMHLQGQHRAIPNHEGYGLFNVEKGEWIDEDECVLEQGIDKEHAVEFRPKPIPLHLLYNGESRTIEFEPCLKVHEVVSQLGETFGLTDDEVQHFGIKGNSTWFQPQGALMEFASGATYCEFRELEVNLFCIVPGFPEKRSLSVRKRATVQELLDTLVSMGEGNIKSPDNYTIMTSQDVVGKKKPVSIYFEDPTNTICDYNLKHGDLVTLTPRLQAFDIALSLEDEIEVDVDGPVASILAQICSHFNSKLNHPHQWSLSPLKDPEAPFSLSAAIEDPDESYGEELLGSSPIVEGIEGAGIPRQSTLYLRQRHGCVLASNVDVTDDDNGDGVAQDIPFWDEPEDSTSNVLFGSKDGKQFIEAGSLNYLIRTVTSTDNHDMTFQKTFLLTYQSFTSPNVLLTKLIERSCVPRALDMGDADYSKAKSIVNLRVGNVLKMWISDYWADFDEPLQERLVKFIQGDFSQSMSSLSTQLLKTIDKKKAVATTGRQRHFNEDPPEPITVYDIDPIEVARQITFADFERYSCIRAPELLNQAWSKPKTQHRSPNVLGFIDTFNILSNWITHDMVRVEGLKARVKRMEWFIKLAIEFQSLQNYSALTSVLAGLNNSATLRLKHTRKDVNKKLMDTLASQEVLMSAEMSYKNYRSNLKSISPPCIPYIGVFLSDLTFIGDGNPDQIGKLINFTKRVMEMNVILDLQQYQQTAYNLKELPELKSEIWKYITEASVIDEKKAYSMSLAIEPRGSTKDKLVL